MGFGDERSNCEIRRRHARLQCRDKWGENRREDGRTKCLQGIGEKVEKCLKTERSKREFNITAFIENEYQLKSRKHQAEEPSTAITILITLLILAAVVVGIFIRSRRGKVNRVHIET